MTGAVLAVMFTATLIRSAIGFGEALIAVPLLAFCLPLATAAPLAVLVSVTIAAVVVLQDWREIEWRSTLALVLATLAGIPLGLGLLTCSHQAAVRAALGLLLLLFAGWSLSGRRPPQLAGDSPGWLLLCGFCAGVLGGAYGMNGPPLAIYGAMRRWSPARFRATLQGYFLPASLLGLAGYAATGLWTPQVTRLFLLVLPVTVPAIFLGRALNRRLRGDAFLRFVYLGLAGVGALLLAGNVG